MSTNSLKFTRFAFALITVSFIKTGFSAPIDNSNLWPVYRDAQTGFSISYPPDWVIVPKKGRNVRFAVNPPTGPGNCNVVARENQEIANMSQAALNREIESLPNDQASWADYIGIPQSQVRVLESSRSKIFDIPALLGVIETTLENLEGVYTRKQIVAVTFTPGLVWSLNCGASTFKANEAQMRFAELQPTFKKILGSFGFLR